MSLLYVYVTDKGYDTDLPYRCQDDSGEQAILTQEHALRKVACLLGSKFEQFLIVNAKQQRPFSNSAFVSFGNISKQDV